MLIDSIVMLPIIEVLLGGGTLGGVAYLISKIRCIFLSKSEDEPVFVMGTSDGSDVVIITAKKERKIC